MPEGKIRLLVVDDHTLFRRGLISLLREFEELEVVGEAADGKAGLALVVQTQPDLLLLDLNMPVMDGLQMLLELRRRNADLRVLMLTISDDSEDLLQAIHNGANGYVLKSTDPESLHRAILQVAAGQGALSPEVITTVMNAVNRPYSGGDAGLSEREKDVLICLSNGLTTPQIAGRLFISENTAKTHIRHILEKLEAGNRAEAIARAAQMGLLDRSERS